MSPARARRRGFDLKRDLCPASRAPARPSHHAAPRASHTKHQLFLRRDSPGLSGISGIPRDKSRTPEGSRARNIESCTPGSPAPERSRARQIASCARNRVAHARPSRLPWPAARSCAASSGYARGKMIGHVRGGRMRRCVRGTMIGACRNPGGTAARRAAHHDPGRQEEQRLVS